jgi:hypothetical protein
MPLIDVQFDTQRLEAKSVPATEIFSSGPKIEAAGKVRQ